jgi:hypothetical protein
MSLGLEKVEEIIISCVRQWHLSLKEKGEFLLMPTKEQKRVAMMQEKAVKDIVYQFSDQREKMAHVVIKRMEKFIK